MQEQLFALEQALMRGDKSKELYLRQRRAYIKEIQKSTILSVQEEDWCA